MTDTTTKTRRSLHLFGVDFTPKMLPSVFLLLFVPLFCALGTWQYHRAQYKKQLLNDLAIRQTQKALAIADINSPQNQEFHPIRATGTLDGAHSLLVQNKFYQHQLGYVVLTPLHLEDGTLVLVDRGWIARNRLDRIEKKQKKLTVEGIIMVPAKKIFQIGETQTQTDGFTTLQNQSWHEILRATKPARILNFIIVLNIDNPMSFQRIFTPTIMSPAKHLGYAVQWFAMALAVFGIFIFTSISRDTPLEKSRKND